MTDAISLAGIAKSFGPKRVLGPLSLTVAEGEVVALFGPNGAGKTTLLKIVAGLARPSAGTVRVLGESPGEPRVRRSLGILGHATWLHDALSAEEDLGFYAALYGLTDARARIERVLNEVGLWERRADRVGTFSRGMRQRLSIARAVLHEPKVILLDEPFSGLDRAATKKLVEFLRSMLSGGGRTVIAVTHELDFGLLLATRVCILSAGSLVLDRAAAGLERSSFESLYLEAVEVKSAEPAIRQQALP